MDTKYAVRAAYVVLAFYKPRIYRRIYLNVKFTVNQQVVVKDFSYASWSKIVAEYLVHLNELGLNSKNVC